MKTNKHIILLGAFFILFGSLPIHVSAQETKDGWNVPAEAKAKRNPILSDEEYIAIGERIYTKRCVSCHGTRGDGKGPKTMAKEYVGYLGDFTSPNYHSTITDGELFYKINQSKGDKPGFANRQIPDPNDRWALLKYIRTLEDSLSTDAEVPATSWEVPSTAKEVRNPILTNTEYIAIGEKIYNKSCASCHGPEGDGNGPKKIAKGYKGYLGDFTSASYHNTISDGELFYMINESKGDKPAFTYRQIQEVEDRWALVKYIRTLEKDN